MKTAFTSAVCVTPVETIRDAVVLVEDGIVISVGTCSTTEIPAGARVIDYGDAVLAPGFVDMHIHGGGGHDVMEGTPDALEVIERHLAKHGTTSYFPTTVTASIDQTLTSLEKLADRIESSSSINSHKEVNNCDGRAVPLGIHMEGPFISPHKRGVHPVEHLQDASVELFDRMWQAARGHITIMTVAPEIAGAEEFIREASRRGICVSLGHSNACARDTRAGIAAGARHVTHTFNAMRAIDRRDPGILGVVLTEDELSAEIIADGVHLAPEIIQLFLKAKGMERSVLVTDAISAAGMPDGEYQLGSFAVTVKNNVCMSEGQLAGSVLTLDRAIRNVMAVAAWPLESVIRMATMNPAQATGVSRRKGTIVAGADADFAVLTPVGHLVATIIAGEQS